MFYYILKVISHPELLNAKLSFIKCLFLILQDESEKNDGKSEEMFLWCTILQIKECILTIPV